MLGVINPVKLIAFAESFLKQKAVQDSLYPPDVMTCGAGKRPAITKHSDVSCEVGVIRGG
ncbi:hypothetical protein DDE20_10055 [Pararhodobacter oceanensis]|uniref:Uncharacterized protein n=1 Tax=Pararhodobacter oceanensis TaxID=2172121 RepID=A0A2T8HV63_9RHOB|nr:hypothetical protein DDE20_10055 [Pararhodobacter oceanensis]